MGLVGDQQDHVHHATQHQWTTLGYTRLHTKPSQSIAIAYVSCQLVICCQNHENEMPNLYDYFVCLIHLDSLDLISKINR